LALSKKLESLHVVVPKAGYFIDAAASVISIFLAN